LNGSAGRILRHAARHYAPPGPTLSNSGAPIAGWIKAP
jgi:hypothetical protein